MARPRNTKAVTGNKTATKSKGKKTAEAAANPACATRGESAPTTRTNQQAAPVTRRHIARVAAEEQEESESSAESDGGHSAGQSQPIVMVRSGAPRAWYRERVYTGKQVSLARLLQSILIKFDTPVDELVDSRLHPQNARGHARVDPFDWGRDVL
ncbi:Hypothetical predicted protein [Lecanosticta acicola]|uniref:Uncharacterized protein n=1 Tax=Lecanosticta acicola TaxID=111012 RepID=A0AAI8Z7X8_9PEZI|nr:Hypothetical predicted protein [Lecanosticta acicola]